MKVSLFLVASLASAAAAETTNLRASASSLIDSMDDADACMSGCNGVSLGKKSKTKTKSIGKSLTKCYNDCMYNKDGSETKYARSLGSEGVREVERCASKCASSAEKAVKKTEKNGKKDSKKYKKCLDSCDGDDKKKCTKKCDKDEDKRTAKDVDSARKKALKDADKCTSRCVADDLFYENVVAGAKAESE